VQKVRDHLEEAMKKLQSESKDSSIDRFSSLAAIIELAASADPSFRHLVANLLVSFFDLPRTDPKRYEILELISGVLLFDSDQRLKVSKDGCLSASEV
jgi:uncharacterized protein with NAD-binding domain and iron-sulfur cluster